VGGLATLLARLPARSANRSSRHPWHRIGHEGRSLTRRVPANDLIAPSMKAHFQLDEIVPFLKENAGKTLPLGRAQRRIA
jgi:hypothetical protein